MTRQRYSFRESLNRILRIFEGKAEPTDQPYTLSGEVLSTDEAASDLAELLAGSLPNETLALPSVMLANSVDTLLGISTTKAVTPDGLDDVMLYGEIYTYTGTVTLTGLAASAFTRITGSFQNSILQDNGYILCQPTTNDRILINAAGSYFVDWSLSFQGSSAVNYEVTPFMNSGSVKQATAKVTPNASGSVTSISAGGIINVTTVGVQIDLRVSPSATAWLKFVASQISVRRITRKSS